MKVTVSITLKNGVLDPEASTIRHSLKMLGYNKVNSVRRIRQIELDLDTDDQEEAKKLAQDMCEKLLANPVIEDYEISTDQ